MKTYSKYDISTLASNVKEAIIAIKFLTNVCEGILNDKSCKSETKIDLLKDVIEVQKEQLNKMIDSLDLTIVRNK